MKIFLIIFTSGVLLAGIAFGAFFFISQLQFLPELKETPTILDVSKGAGFNEIIDEIYSKGLIRSKNVFKIYAFLSGSAHRLQNGKYKFNSAVSIPELVDVLRIGPKDISIIIFPGMTLKEIDDRLSEEEIVKKGDLTNYNDFEKIKSHYAFLEDAVSLEGFLLPDTYLFRYDSDIDSVIEKILDNFEKKAMAVINSDGDGAGVDKKNDKVLRLITIASYLEKEIPDGEERKIAAGIMEKRLKVGMPLQIDATILYNKCSGRFSDCSSLKKEDFKIDSAYNTYLRAGLTPTPITNPSLEAIKSAIDKKESPYWYYLSDPKTKKTIFSENLDKHNANRVKYLLNNK